MAAVCSATVMTTTRSQSHVAFARSAVKGLRSQSLAPINASPKARRALDCPPCFGSEVNRGAAAPHLKMANTATDLTKVSTMS